MPKQPDYVVELIDYFKNGDNGVVCLFLHPDGTQSDCLLDTDDFIRIPDSGKVKHSKVTRWAKKMEGIVPYCERKDYEY